MTLRFGCVYRHRISGVRFRVDEIWIRENSIEGGQSVATRCVVLNDEETTCVVGETVIARWWPHLEEVGERGVIPADSLASTAEADAAAVQTM